MEIKDFNTVDATADVLGVDRKTAYAAIGRNEIPHIRIGRAIRVPGAWLRSVAAQMPTEKAVA